MRNSLKMKIALLYTISLTLLLVSCGPEEKPEQLKLINETLERVNSSITYDCKLRINSWQDRCKDPQTTALAERYLPRINKIHLYGDSLMMMIESIKSEIITQSDSLKMEYVTIVKQLYVDNGVGSKLFMKLAAFSDSIPALIHLNDPANKHLPEGIPLLPGYADSLTAKGRVQYEKNWLEKCFGRSSSLMAMIILNKIENDVLTTEKMLFEYCESNFCILPVRYNRWQSDKTE